LGGRRIIKKKSHFVPQLSRLRGLMGGVTVTSLGAVLAETPQRLEPFYARPATQRNAFAAFNDVLAEDGAFIHLSAGVSVAAPIHLVFHSAPGADPLLSSVRSVVLADLGSRATIVESYLGTEDGVYCTNAVTQIV